jgi:hypothetical protein
VTVTRAGRHWLHTGAGMGQGHYHPKQTALAAVLLLCTFGCARAQERGVQLYQGPPDEAAITLVGDVKTVDGDDVPTRARSFRLLPGCHVVTNVTYGVARDPNAAATTHVLEMPYWMAMRSGYSYELRIATTRATGAAEGTVLALERDGEGEITKRFQPGRACEEL